MPKVATKRVPKKSATSRCRSRDSHCRFPIPLDSLVKLNSSPSHEGDNTSIQARRVSFEGASLECLAHKRKMSFGSCLKRTRPCLLSLVSDSTLEDGSTLKTSLSSSSSLSSSNLLLDVAASDSETSYEYGFFVDVVPPDDAASHMISLSYKSQSKRKYATNLTFSPYPLNRASLRRSRSYRLQNNIQYENSHTESVSSVGATTNNNIKWCEPSKQNNQGSSSLNSLTTVKSCGDMSTALNLLQIQ